MTLCNHSHRQFPSVSPRSPVGLSHVSCRSLTCPPSASRRSLVGLADLQSVSPRSPVGLVSGHLPDSRGQHCRRPVSTQTAVNIRTATGGCGAVASRGSSCRWRRAALEKRQLERQGLRGGRERTAVKRSVYSDRRGKPGLGRSVWGQAWKNLVWKGVWRASWAASAWAAGGEVPGPAGWVYVCGQVIKCMRPLVSGTAEC